MYTAVIADDEVWIRKWLEQVLSNDDKEIRVAASLDDGLKVKEFLEKEGYITDINEKRRHHEIYFNDPRKTAPEKLKTIIRHPVRKV